MIYLPDHFLQFVNKVERNDNDINVEGQCQNPGLFLRRFYFDYFFRALSSGLREA